MYQQHANHGGAVYTAAFEKYPPAEAVYRYTLSREWGPKPSLFESAGPHADQSVLFIMLNPSTADAMKDDPTVAKCMRLAKAWGYGGIEVRNLFALRSKDPNDLRVCLAQGGDPIGGTENDHSLIEALASSRIGLVVAAWGITGTLLQRDAQAVKILIESKRPVYAFALSNSGQPVHPLYQSEDVTPEKGMVRFL